jgi:L-fuculose-phosphate aldolase
MVYWSHKVWEKGWVANHDGNLTSRIPGGRYLCTPTAFSKGEIKEGDLLVLNSAGQKIQGRHRTFSELSMHLAAYGARSDFNAVIHAHPPVTVGLSLAGKAVETTILAEAVVSLGDRVPAIPFSMPKSETQREHLIQYLPFFDIVILERHGVLAGGNDLEQAYLRIELLEHLAHMTHVANHNGGAQSLSDHQVHTLMRARHRAGLGPQARGVTGEPPA